MTRVFITDARYKMSLAPIRSLWAAGYRLVCCEEESVPDKQCLGFYSRYVGEKVRVPAGSDNLLGALEELCSSGDVVLPVGRSSVRALSMHSSEARSAAFLVSSPETLIRADDKAYVFHTAKKLGIPVPFTSFLSEHRSIEDLAGAVNYPCIIKYRDGEALGLHSHQRYSIARNQTEFKESYARMNDLSPDPLAQEYLNGRDIGVAVVMDGDSEPVDFICYESQREYPISGGPTCLCRTIFDRALLKNACTILKELSFVGIAMLDFKGTPDSPRILEINPRVWGSAYICTVSGSTFFKSYVEAALGKAKPLNTNTCTPSYRLGARMRFFPQSIFALWEKARSGEFSKALCDVKSSLDFSIRDGLFQWRDPRPFLKYLQNSI